jgi:hypothetical protein
MADAAFAAWSSQQEIERVTIGTVTQRPDPPKGLGTQRAIHFATTTPWGISVWDGASWQNVGVCADPTGNVTITTENARKPIDKSRITIGALAQRPGYAAGSDQALHFLTVTTWTLSYWNGVAWASVSLLGDPTGDAVLSLFQARAGITSILAGTAAQRPSLWAGAPNMLHFATDTPYAMSYFNGSAWASIALMTGP